MRWKSWGFDSLFLLLLCCDDQLFDVPENAIFNFSEIRFRLERRSSLNTLRGNQFLKEKMIEYDWVHTPRLFCWASESIKSLLSSSIGELWKLHRSTEGKEWKKWKTRLWCKLFSHYLCVVPSFIREESWSVLAQVHFVSLNLLKRIQIDSFSKMIYFFPLKLWEVFLSCSCWFFNFSTNDFLIISNSNKSSVSRLASQISNLNVHQSQSGAHTLRWTSLNCRN